MKDVNCHCVCVCLCVCVDDTDKVTSDKNTKPPPLGLHQATSYNKTNKMH